MSVRNIRGRSYDLKKCLYPCLWILVMNLLVIMAPARGGAWFHHPSTHDHTPVFESPQSKSLVSDTYIISQNRGVIDSRFLYREFQGTVIIPGAGRIKINIPFNLLSKTVINSQALLDRQIAANLKVRNMLEQYLAMKKRNAELLKDLRIPYLDGDEKKAEKKQAQVLKKIEPAHEIKQKMAEVILFQGNGGSRLPAQENPDFQATLTGNQKEYRAPLPYGGKGESSLRQGYSDRVPRPHQTGYGADTELPWIFDFGLAVFRYVVENKIEILTGAAVLVMLGLIGVLVIKR